MSFVFRLLLNGLAVYFTAVLINFLFPALQPIVIRSYLVAVVVSVVMSLMNLVVRPILQIVTLPINILTLGLFSWVISGIVILLVPPIVNTLVVPDGFAIHGASMLGTLGWAIVFSFIVTFVQSTLQILVK